MNRDDEIMAEYSAQRLVDHRNVRLAAKAITEIPFHHGERRFDIRTLVVALQKFVALEHNDCRGYGLTRSVVRTPCEPTKIPRIFPSPQPH